MKLTETHWNFPNPKLAFCTLSYVLYPGGPNDVTHPATSDHFKNICWCHHLTFYGIKLSPRGAFPVPSREPTFWCSWRFSAEASTSTVAGSKLPLGTFPPERLRSRGRPVEELNQVKLGVVVLEPFVSFVMSQYCLSLWRHHGPCVSPIEKLKRLFEVYWWSFSAWLFSRRFKRTLMEKGRLWYFHLFGLSRSQNSVKK